MKINLKIISSLEKSYRSTGEHDFTEIKRISGLKGETVSLQLDYCLDYGRLLWGELTVGSDDPKLTESITVRRVELVPVTRPVDPSGDDHYLESEPCALPDMLSEMPAGKFPLVPNYHRSLWMDVDIPEDIRAGIHEISFTVKCCWKEDNAEETVKVSLDIIDALLPELEIAHTEWFYGDCIADYYGVDFGSEEFFGIAREFVRTAVKRNINTNLVPLLTPALDTGVGLERTTAQLVDIEKMGENYSFSFAGLRRWIEMCLEEGVRYFEMSHLFTQWGCKAAPKVVATVDGKKQRIFGWDTPSDSPEYASFLRKFLPALKKELVELKVYDRTFFHISDEPRKDNRENYKKANALVRSILPDAVFLDALSDLEFYREGLINIPACGTNKITPFIEGKVKNLWAYYCCTQTTKSPNRFIAMPSSRNRVLGQQLFKYDIKGFLHWGYNFYNCMYSYHHIDPYRTVDAEGGVPGGDPFLVYPGKGGRPDESIRLMVLSEAFNDFRALKLLASLSSFEEAVSFLDEGLTFSDYPMESDYCISLRERVNRRIGELV